MNIKERRDKGSNIVYEKFTKQPYLMSNRLSYDQKCLLFKLRSSMTLVKSNYSSMFENIDCNNCEMNVPESDSHLLECTKMIEICKSLHDDCPTEYFGNFWVTQIYEAIFQAKAKLEASN